MIHERQSEVLFYTVNLGRYDQPGLVNLELSSRRPIVVIGDDSASSLCKLILSTIGWSGKLSDEQLGCNIFMSRILKFGLPLIAPFHSIYVYVDGNVILQDDVEVLVSDFKVSTSQCLFFKHLDRSNWGNELAYILANKNGASGAKNVYDMMQKEFGHTGATSVLTENCLFFLKNDPTCIELLKTTLNLWIKFPSRDQLLTGIALSQTTLRPTYVNRTSRIDNRYYRLVGHRTRGISNLRNTLCAYRRVSSVAALLFPIVDVCHRINERVKKCFIV